MEYRFTIIDGSTETVIDEPIGWDTIEFKLIRDMNYHGIFTEFSTDLKFIGTGLSIISNKFNTYGVEGLLTLKIEESCDYIQDFSEVGLYRINLAGYREFADDFCYCVVNLESINLSMLLKNNEDKVVNLSESVTVEETELPALTENTMQMHSKAIVLTSVFDTLSLSVPTNSTVPTPLSSQTFFLGLPVYVKSNDLSISGSTGGFGQIMVTPVTDIADVNNFFVAPYTGTYDLVFNAKGFWSDYSLLARTYNIGFTYKKNSDANAFLYDLGSKSASGGGTVTDNFDIENITLTLSLNENDTVKVFFTIANYEGSSTPSVFNSTFALNFETANIYFKSQTETDSSTAKTYLIHEAFERVTQVVTDKVNVFESDYFGRKDLGYDANGCGSFTAITNGFNIRDFDKPVNLTLKDTFNSLSAIHALGLGIVDNKIRVEDLDYFYDITTDLASFTYVKPLSKEVNESLIYNTLTIGFDKYGTEEGTDKNNTLDGFATQHVYNLPITTVKNELKKVSTFIADHYAIEFTRRQQYLTTSTNSWKFDEDNFIICTKRTEVDGVATELNYPEKDENFTVINNCLSPETGYNLRLTPTRMLLKWNAYFAGAYSKIAGTSAKFGSGISNYLYESQLEGLCKERYNNQLLIENQNLAFDDSKNESNQVLFEPVIIRFKAPLKRSLYNTIALNPSGVINVGYSSTLTEKGFIKTITYKPNEGIGEFELLKAYVSNTECDMIYVETPYVECEYVE
jgi:hypothetical protein